MRLVHRFGLVSAEERRDCHLLTLLKGAFSLLAIKTPAVALHVSTCCLKLFFKLFECELHEQQPRGSKGDAGTSGVGDFKKAFNFCFETVRGLLIYAKEGKFDELFVEADLPT